MGGKVLKYPVRQKYTPSEEKKEEVQEVPVSPEEHERRLKVLREAGLIK